MFQHQHILWLCVPRRNKTNGAIFTRIWRIEGRKNVRNKYPTEILKKEKVLTVALEHKCTYEFRANFSCTPKTSKYDAKGPEHTYNSLSLSLTENDLRSFQLLFSVCHSMRINFISGWNWTWAPAIAFIFLSLSWFVCLSFFLSFVSHVCVVRPQNTWHFLSILLNYA